MSLSLSTLLADDVVFESFKLLLLLLFGSDDDVDCTTIIFVAGDEDNDGFSSILNGNCVTLYGATGGGPHDTTGRFLERKLGRDTNCVCGKSPIMVDSNVTGCCSEVSA